MIGRSASARDQLEARALDLLHHTRRDADVGDHHLAGLLLGGRQHQRQLGRAERDRHRRLDAVADQLGGIGGHAGWQVDRDDRNAAGVEVGDHRLVKPLQGCAQPGAEHRIDHQVVRAHLGEMQLPGALVSHLDDGDPEAPEDVEVDAGVALDLGDPAHEEDRCLDPALIQRPGDDEAIAAVVALARDDGDATFGEIVVERLQRGHHLPAGVLHQHDRRDADIVDGGPIGLPHLRRVQDPHSGSLGFASGSLGPEVLRSWGLEVLGPRSWSLGPQLSTFLFSLLTFSSVSLHRRAHAHEVTVAVRVVDAADRRPHLVGPDPWQRIRRPLARVGMGPRRR